MAHIQHVNMFAEFFYDESRDPWQNLCRFRHTEEEVSPHYVSTMGRNLSEHRKNGKTVIGFEKAKSINSPPLRGGRSILKQNRYFAILYTLETDGRHYEALRCSIIDKKL